MEANNVIDPELLGTGNARPTFQVNFKRILARAIARWYLVVFFVVIMLAGAYAYNRYAQRQFTVNASIIVREGTENAAAEFLYKSNPLVNPYRNFYNELYIMRSYPLLQEVVEQLNFQVAWYREGNVKTTEIYDRNFPYRLYLVDTKGKPYGKNLGFTAKTDSTYSLEYLRDDGAVVRKLDDIQFGDTVQLNGFTLITQKTTGTRNDYLNKYFIVEFKDPFAIAKQYSTRLTPKWAEQGSSVINLSLSGPLPEKETDFLNKFIERYQQYDADKKSLVASKSIEFLDKQLKNIGDSLQYFDNRIEDFKQINNGQVDFAAASQQLLERMQGIETQLSQLALFSNYFAYLETYLKQGNDLDQIVPPSAVGISDPIITELITKLMEVQFSMRMLGSQQSEENPLVAEQRARIKQLRGDILEGVKSIKATQSINRDFLKGQLAELERELGKLPVSERTMIDIKRNYTIRENLYLFLMQKRAEAGISRASTTSDVVVVNPPTTSGGFITPKPLMNYAMALVAGLLIPFLIFFIAELVNDKVQSKEDIEQLTSIPLIGAVGHNAKSGNLAVYERPRSALAESFRALRSNLNYFTENQDKKVILITSSVSGEGKSFTTINLATTMALAGKKVLIIGADMRKPRIYPDFNLSNERGLSSFLSGMHALEDVIQQTLIANLDLISSGPVPPNPSELLLMPKVATMFETLLGHYDYILLDTPPLGLVSDAFALIPFAHHTIFMIRQNYSPRNFLSDLQELAEKRDLRHISILFNDIQKTGPGYGYGYGYGYGFGDKNKRGGGYYED